jgi:hypothetical protein
VLSSEVRGWKSTAFAAAVVAIALASPAHAASLSPGDTRTALTPGPVGPDPAFAVQRSWGAATPVIGLQTHSIGNVHGAGQAPIAITADPGSAGFFPNGPYTFYDNYFFDVAPPSVSNASAISITLGNQGFDRLESRFYRVGDAGSTSGPLYYGQVPGGAYQAWVMASGSVQTAVISNALLEPGTWTLEIRGRTLADGGSYGGNVNFSPVPLPAAAWLMIGGLGLLGLNLRRRSAGGVAAA